MIFVTTKLSHDWDILTFQLREKVVMVKEVWKKISWGTPSSQFDTRIELSGVSVCMFIHYFYKVQKYTCIGKYVSVCYLNVPCRTLQNTHCRSCKLNIKSTLHEPHIVLCRFCVRLLRSTHNMRILICDEYSEYLKQNERKIKFDQKCELICNNLNCRSSRPSFIVSAYS
jgi:hypothetical protein